MYVVSNKGRGPELSKTFEIKISDTGHGAIGVGTCPAGFKS